MFMIGRNVEVKIENGMLTIQCEINIAGMSYSRALRSVYLANTDGLTDIPNTDLSLNLYLVRKKSE